MIMIILIWSELAEKLCFELNSSKFIQELDLSKTKFVPVLNEDWGSPIVNKQCEIQPHLMFFIIWFMILYWGSLWQLSNPIRIISEKRSSYNHHNDKHDHHHHPHITPVKMRESLKFSFLPTSSSPPAVVSAIILSNNFANKV